MTAQDGANVLLAVGNGAGPEVFATVGGMRITAMTLANRPPDATTRESGAWRQLQSGAGARALTITGSGVFTDASSEDTLRGYAFAATGNNYRLTFPNGDTLTGAFIVSAYSRNGTVGEAEAFTLTLESAGAVAYSG